MSHKVFAHRYKWSHNKRRHHLKKWLKEGKVKLLAKEKDGWLYEVIDSEISERIKKIKHF